VFAKKTDNYQDLPKEQRRLVWFARQANNDTWGGGCRALVLAEKQGQGEAQDVVSAVYSASNGKVPDELDAFECGECGCVHYGREAAERCCSPEEEDFVDDTDLDDVEETDEE
jgi:rubrerythrin